MDKQQRRLYLLTLVILLGFAGAGILADGARATLTGLVELQIHPARLLNDYTLAAGEGAALLNASLVAFIGLILVRVTGVRLSGPTIAAVFTLFGFGLFGKTPLNVTPVLLGVFVSAKLAGKKFSEYILIALFGTALAPLVSLVGWELGLHAAIGIPGAIAAGLVAGIVLPPLALAMLRLHQGYSLYNIGLTTGFFALFAAAIIFGGRDQLAGGGLWNTEPTLLLQLLVPATSVVLVIGGLLTGRLQAVRSFVGLHAHPGRLPSDFMSMESIPGALINMGVLGLVMWGYAVAVGAPLNGPVLGGMFTVIGFAAFGKHLRNVWPVMAGIVIAALVFGLDLTTPGVILAVLFGTTLAPIAGDFGVLVGIVAGFLHLAIVMRSGAWHAGIGLYNNGLAAGLTATLLVSIIEWYRTNVARGRLRGAGSPEKEKR